MHITASCKMHVSGRHYRASAANLWSAHAPQKLTHTVARRNGVHPGRCLCFAGAGDFPETVASRLPRPGHRGHNPHMSTDQLPLPFQHQPGYAAADFLAAPSNEAARTWLDRTEDWPEQRLALWGGAGCGKTHLLRLWAGRRGARLLSVSDVTGLLEPLPPAGIAVDDADSAADEPLLHLLNAAREARLPVLLAARAAPARWPVRLPDLASRLRAVTAVQILPPEDSLLRALLMRLLADRQLRVGPGLQEWLLLRLPRSPAALRDAVARLDRAALATGGGITRTIAAATLQAMGGDIAAAPEAEPNASPV